MQIDIEALAREYTQAFYVVAKAEQNGMGFDHDLVDIPHAIIGVIRSIFPDVGNVTLFWNRKTRMWDVAHRDQETSHTTDAAAMSHATTIIHGLFEDLRLAAGIKGENPPGVGESNPLTPHDLPPEVVGVSFHLARFLLPPRRVTCPHCGKTPLEK